ncbi:MAG: valine--tRNA ligase [Candidatus Andersenbacteria bacterium RIFCSPHIGHO2_12_FULL_45_11b]|uniref:Valine--tRNA ligase n=1 Tax=Candidatus Andersenbacteria bacterium RIFCSPHIGHO2_12_FULL_45_11b TaxID=1797282 RepID=A0A1G1X593_9BACT|nr:MAG: valine--tRNA ligase [Candidatus Andersenbacteria bacterium RIFCSPHIGHO2_12_FULL_45_11b]
MRMPALSAQYSPKDHEQSVYKKWEDSGAFQPNEELLKQGKKPFVVMLPPPNITGVLHMGHALQDTIMDILVRWHRMKGEPTLWMPGTDHAALPTNKIIVDQLFAEGKTKEEIGRAAFIEKTEKWYEKTGAQILNQMKRLGASCDWTRNRFTMDTKYVQAVNETFLSYYKKGYIYRGARIVNWDPKTQTTVSDLEIEYKTEKAPLYTFRYGPFEISTARPETKFGDKYVVMHPDDPRYAQYAHGDTFTAPWINGDITATVIKDESVDMKFGTGVMTITPWHDLTDFAIAERHNLGMEQIIDFNGKLLPIAGEFAGMNIAAARPKIAEKLESLGLLISVDAKYQHNVALNDRGKGVIEPQVMRQWFVDMSKLKEEAIAAAENDQIRFIPPRWKSHFIDWMEHVHDWNINRQIWLGHRLPVWWKKGTHGTDQEDGNFVVSSEKPEGDYEQDPDTLDTWFSSSLWPFATLGWPDATDDLRNYYPTSVLVTAREILYLWVARMIFSGLELVHDIPFRDVLIHPVVLAKNGQRMSKSLGTGIDPIELIEAHGADATRFGLMHQMSFDMQQMKFDPEAIRAAQNFANKLWNIARLLDELKDRRQEGAADMWIRARAYQVSQEVGAMLAAYKIGEAARLLQDFVWYEFADWYLEIVKKEGSTAVARAVFADIIKMLHPFMPHITEVLWEHAGNSELLITSPWEFAEYAVSQEAIDTMRVFQSVVTAVRSARIVFGIPMGSVVEIYSDASLPMPETLEALARVHIVAEAGGRMRSYPLSTGGVIMLYAAEITEEALKKGRDRLNTRAQTITAKIQATQQIIESMRGRAPEEKVQEKQNELARLQQQLQDIDMSRGLLK